MPWPKGKSRKKVVGGSVRNDAEPMPVQQVWRTDEVEGRQPGFSYQFMHENEVRDRKHPKRVFDRHEGAWKTVQGWSLVNEDEVFVSSGRPDLGAPLDTGAVRRGPHVLMKIPDEDYALLEHEKDAVPDAIEQRLMAGKFEQPNVPGRLRFQQDPFIPHPGIPNQDME